MHRKFWYLLGSMVFVSVLIAGTILGLGGGANAITYGVPDGEDHPYIGIIAFYDGNGDFLWRATGTLLSPTVLLTAGHVTYGPSSARVWFDSDVTGVDPTNPTGGYTGTPIPHPAYDNFATFPNTSDVGVIILDEPVYIDTYGELPELGALDALATKRGRQERLFTTVGYGYQSVKPYFQADTVRYKATSMLVNLHSNLTDGYNLHTSDNPGKGQGTGGSCFGDSGGPVLLGDSNEVVAVVSFGLNNNCKGADFSYRTDISNTQDFINTFLD